MATILIHLLSNSISDHSPSLDVVIIEILDRLANLLFILLLRLCDSPVVFSLQSTIVIPPP